MVLAITAEPPNFLPEQFNDINAMYIGWNIVERLTERDSKTFETKGQLAEKWQQVDPKTLRITLRKGVKYHNGNPFGAADVQYTIQRDIQPDSQILRYIPNVTEAKVVDDSTVDIILKDPDPIMATRLYYVPIVNAKFGKESPERLPIEPIGTGPYKFVEWVRGQFIRLTVNEAYWGPAPAVKDATYVFRSESSVRAAMVRTGEAQFAVAISPEDAKNVPKLATGPSNETMMLRLDTQTHDALKDKRVRKAVALAIDKETLTKTLYAGYATVAPGQMYPPFTIGFDASLKAYPFDKDGAKKLIAEAKAAGVNVDAEMAITAPKGRWIRDAELTEALVNMLKDVGLNAKVNIVEYSKWREWLYSAGPGQPHNAILLSGHSQDLGDASLSYDSYVVTGGRMSYFSNAEFDKLEKAGSQAGGQDRITNFQKATAIAYDEVPIVPMIYLNQIHGMAKNLNWSPRTDVMLLLNEFIWTD